MEEIGLVEAITALRSELSTAIMSADPQGLRFLVGEVTVELEMAVERVGEGSGSVKFWVLNAGGGRSRKDARTHRMKIPLTPILGDGSPVLTGEKDLPI